MRTGWRRTFVAANVGAETLVSLALAVSGLFTALQSSHVAIFGELTAACLIAWSGSADPLRTARQRRAVLAGLTVVLVVLAAVEVGISTAVLVGLAYAPSLIRRMRAITTVHESEVQGGRLAWDVVLLSAAWLYPIVASAPRLAPAMWRWLAVLSVLVVVARLLAMHSAQMQATSLAVVRQSRSTAVTLVTMAGVVFVVLVLAYLLPRFPLVLIIALVVGIVGFAILLTWRALIAGLAAVLLTFGFSYLLRELLTGHKHAFTLPRPISTTKNHVHLRPPAHPWWTHVPWGLIGLAVVLCIVVLIVMRMRVPSAVQQPDVQNASVERERLPKRPRSTRGLPPTPLRRVVARWLRQREKSHPLVRGETLQAYVRRELAPHLPEFAHLSDAYDAERYGSQPQPQADAARIEAALREAGLWHP